MFNKHNIIDINRTSEQNESFSQSTFFPEQVDTCLHSQFIVKSFQQWWNIFYTECDGLTCKKFHTLDLHKILKVNFIISPSILKETGVG